MNMWQQQWLRAVAVGLSAFACSASDDGGGQQGSSDNQTGPSITETDNGADDTGSLASSGAAGSAAIGASGSVASGGASGVAAYSPGVVYINAADAGVATEPIATTPPITNPFTIAAHDPLSTFAADVDTASYDLFVRDINSSRLPASQTVRLEEFVNYFRYDYPAPAADAEHPFALSLAAAPNLFADGTMTLRIGIQGKLPPPFEKKPVNLVFLTDVSGSMQTPEKLPLVQFLMTDALSVLEPTDTVSIVTYASGTAVPLGPTPVSSRSIITSAINGLTAGGSTNGAGGIQLAYQQAESAFIPDGINHVVLCTDGDFNVGVSDTAGLVDLIEEKRRTGITLTVLGFGAGRLNDSMMEAVSNAGNGIYGVITTETQAARYVEERLLSTLVHIAKDVKIQVEFNPAEVYAYRLLGYENRAIADTDFRNDILDAGEIGAGHRVTALYQLVLRDGEIPEVAGAAPLDDGAPYDGPVEVAPTDLVLVKVRYKTPGALETDPAFEVNSSLAPSAFALSLETADPDFQWAAAVGGFAEILRQSPYADVSALEAMGAIIDSRAGADPDRLEFRTLFQRARELL